jgi:hypothetical protein
MSILTKFYSYPILITAVIGLADTKLALTGVLATWSSPTSFNTPVETSIEPKRTIGGQLRYHNRYVRLGLTDKRHISVNFLG